MSAQPSLLERFGLWALTAGGASQPPPSDPIDVLLPHEQRALLWIEIRAVLYAGLAGALSAALCVWASLWALAWEAEPLVYWALVGSSLGLTTLVEVAFLYWYSLRAVREMARAAGLRVQTSTELDHALALALARAALELPNPPRNLLAVDPHREASKLALVASSLLYKAKIALTNFVFKALLRRALGRAATRALLEWVAVPVGALWNMLVMYQVLQQARLRVIGPSAARHLAAWIEAPAATPELAGAQHELVLRALGSSIVANREAHPNVLELGRLLLGDVPAVQLHDLGDRPRLLELLRGAPPSAQSAVLRTVVAVAILDGKVTRRERQWLEICFAAAGATLSRTELHALRRRFVRGSGLGLQALPTL